MPCDLGSLGSLGSSLSHRLHGGGLRGFLLGSFLDLFHDDGHRIRLLDYRSLEGINGLNLFNLYGLGYDSYHDGLFLDLHLRHRLGIRCGITTQGLGDQERLLIKSHGVICIQVTVHCVLDHGLLDLDHGGLTTVGELEVLDNPFPCFLYC